MRRRDFLAAWGAAALAGCAPGAAPPLPPGELAGGDFELGHRLAGGDFPAPAETRRTGVLIIGAGVAGLSAAWRLQRAGFQDFAVLELEAQAGGNSRSGRNGISAYPLGAHYLPLPNPEARAVRTLLADLGVLRGDPAAEAPVYDEAYLCHAPQERLYRQGLWQEGLVPHLHLAAGEQAQQARFFARMGEFKAARDDRGRRLFALPTAYAGETPASRALEQLTMHDWMRAEGFDAPSLHWYVNYACRDDYGTDYRQVSAWAGIHYFACRTGRGGEGAGETVLTAPEGNGWIVNRLAGRLGPALHTGCAVHALRQGPTGISVQVWDRKQERSLEYQAGQVIWAAPLYLLPRLARELPADLAAAIAPLGYAPWLVATLSLTAPPEPGAGMPLAWDNVLYDSPGLGYVVATHQQLRRDSRGPTVLSYYRPLSDADPRAARARLLSTSRETWAEEILADLSRAHRDIRRLTTRLDLFRHGHAMVRPLPGLRRRARLERLAAGWGRVQLAHGDLGCLSLFEEANYWGVRAAEHILAGAGGRLRERLV